MKHGVEALFHLKQCTGSAFRTFRIYWWDDSTSHTIYPAKFCHGAISVPSALSSAQFPCCATLHLSICRQYASFLPSHDFMLLPFYSSAFGERLKEDCVAPKNLKYIFLPLVFVSFLRLHLHLHLHQPHVVVLVDLGSSPGFLASWSLVLQAPLWNIITFDYLTASC